MAKPLVQSTGRRKESVARVRLYDGTGRLTLNGKPLEQYFPTMAQRMRVLEPLRVAGSEGRYDIEAKLEGGGTTGQADALRLGIARGLIELDPRPAPRTEEGAACSPVTLGSLNARNTASARPVAHPSTRSASAAR